MERYADRVQNGIAASQGLSVAPVALQRQRAGARWHYDRLIAYTVNAGRRHGDVFHIVDHGFAHLARWLPSDRVVVTCHDLMALRSLMGQTGERSRSITVNRFRWSVGHMRSVAHVVCDSSATRHDVIELVGVPAERVTVVPLGVDEQFRPLEPAAEERIRRAHGVGDRVVIGNVSTGGTYKNPAAVLHTLRILLDRGVPAVMLRAGRPFGSQDQQLVDRLALRDNIIERGIVSDEELVELYNASDVVLHPSYWEGFGWPPLEAMSCGTPVVTSSAASLLEVTGGCGLSADPDDHAGLADCVQAAIQPDTGDLLRRRGLARADTMRWNRSLSQLFDVYAAVLDSASSPSQGRVPSRRRARPLEQEPRRRSG